MPTRSSADRAFVLAALILVAMTIAAFWVVDYLPTNDGPDHVFAGWLENHVGDLTELDRERVVLHAQLTAHGFRVLFVPLERWLGWRDALRATETIWALAFALSLMSLVAAVAPARRWLGLLGFPAAFQWSLYMGFFSFWAASAFGLFTLALALRRDPWRAIDRVVMAAMLFFTAMLHAFVPMLVGAILLAIVLARSSRRLRELGLLALVGLPSAAVALLTAMANQGEGHAVDTSTWIERATSAGSVFAVGPWWRTTPFVALAALGYISAFSRFRARTPIERALCITGAIFLVASMVSPRHLAHWQFLSPRFVVLGVVLGLVLVEVEKLGAFATLALRAGVASFALAAVAWSIHFHHQLADACDPGLAGLRVPVKRSGFTAFLPLTTCFTDTPIDHVPYVSGSEPLWKAASLYAVAQGGLAVGLNGVRELHSYSLVYGPITQEQYTGDWDRRWIENVLAPGPMTPERERERFTLVTRLAEIGATNDNLVIYGKPEHRRLITERGFQVDWENESLSFTHFVGCPFDLELPPGWANALVEYGWWPHAEPLALFRSRDTTMDATRARLPRTPCGPIWIRVTTDAGQHCAGADASGRILAKSDPSSTSYRCTTP